MAPRGGSAQLNAALDRERLTIELRDDAGASLIEHTPRERAGDRLALQTLARRRSASTPSAAPTENRRTRSPESLNSNQRRRTATPPSATTAPHKAQSHAGTPIVVCQPIESRALRTGAPHPVTHRATPREQSHCDRAELETLATPAHEHLPAPSPNRVDRYALPPDRQKTTHTGPLNKGRGAPRLRRRPPVQGMEHLLRTRGTPLLRGATSARNAP